MSLLLVEMALLLLSCDSQRPSDVLSEKKMERILYDLHIAQAIAKNSTDSTDYKMVLYANAVYDKHGVKPADFEHSLEWYTRHSDQLFTIYKNVDQKIAELTSSSSWSVEALTYATTGDTANIWTDRNLYLLSSNGTNRLSFYIPTDTMVSPRDKLEFLFDTQWMYSEGQKSATVMMIVRFDNDSLQFANSQLLTTGKQRLVLRVGNRQVKSVEGLVYMQSDWNEKTRLMVVSNPLLLRYKSKGN